MNIIINILTGKKIQLLIGTLLLISSIVTIRHYSGPIKLVFLFELISFCIIGITLNLITGKKYWSWIVALIFYSILTEISLIKQDYIGQKLYVSDFSNILSEPLILIGFINSKLILILVLLFAISFLLFFEKTIRRFLIYKLILLTLLVFSGWNILKDESFVWRWNIEKSDGNFTMLVGEFFHPKKLKFDNLNVNETCCQRAVNEDIKLKRLNNNDKPNIIAILLESQTNLDNLKGFKNWGSDWSDFSPISSIVYAKGGGTWIQEYALLHGVNPQIYGESYDKINILGPSKLDGRLAPSLKNEGYETSSFLAYRKKFYNTEIFHKSLGIDNIIDCKDREDCKRDGSYFGIDENMFDSMLKKLKNSKSPQFFLSVTMTNHGPYSGVGLKDIKKCPLNINDQLCGELNDYYQRSEKLKKLISNFVLELNKLEKRTIVIFFGDHISPTLASSFKTVDYIDSKDNEAILFAYDSGSKTFLKIHEKLKLCDKPIPSENIDSIALYLADYNSQYINKKLIAMRNC